MRRVMKIGWLFAALLSSVSISAADGHDGQNDCQHDGWQLKARIGYNIGGTAPLGIPATIRSIEAFKGILAPMKAVSVHYANATMDTRSVAIHVYRIAQRILYMILHAQHLVYHRAVFVIIVGVRTQLFPMVVDIVSRQHQPHAQIIHTVITNALR